MSGIASASAGSLYPEGKHVAANKATPEELDRIAENAAANWNDNDIDFDLARIIRAAMDKALALAAVNFLRGQGNFLRDEINAGPHESGKTDQSPGRDSDLPHAVPAPNLERPMTSEEQRLIEAAVDLYRMDCTITWFNFLSAAKAMPLAEAERSVAADLIESAANTALAVENSKLRILLGNLVEAVDRTEDLDEADGPQFEVAMTELEEALSQARPHTEQGLIESLVQKKQEPDAH